MTLKEAYEKAKAQSEYKHLQSCRDFGEFWGFIFAPVDNPNTLMLGGFNTVNKHTGELGVFLPQMDFELADEAINIPLDQIIKSTPPPPAAANTACPPITKRRKLAYA